MSALAPGIAVIVVNYNGGSALLPHLSEAIGQAGEGAEVVVVDNASTDGSVGSVRSLPVDLIENSSNLGFAAAVNQAIGRTTAPYLLLLNPDARLRPGVLDVGLTYMDENPDVAVLGARVLLPNGQLDPAARRSFKTPITYMYKALGLSRLMPDSPRFGRYYLSYLDQHRISDVDAVVGAFMLTRRSVVNAIGGMDERFFMYCEDEDFCWRAKQAGGRVVYHPGVVVDHDKGTSSRQTRFRMAYHWHRSILLYHRKNIARRYNPAVNGLVYAGIIIGLAIKEGCLVWGTTIGSPRRRLPFHRRESAATVK